MHVRNTMYINTRTWFQDRFRQGLEMMNEKKNHLADWHSLLWLSEFIINHACVIGFSNPTHAQWSSLRLALGNGATRPGKVQRVTDFFIAFCQTSAACHSQIYNFMNFATEIASINTTFQNKLTI